MARTIRSRGFDGMNNVQQGVNELLTYPSYFIRPRIILNADVIKSAIVIRDGNEKICSLAGAHSLSDNLSIQLCVTKGVLYRIEGGTAVTIGSLDGDAPTCYLEIGTKIYISNKFGTKIYNTMSQSFGNWGLACPIEKPEVTVISGNLPSGTYHVTFTDYRSDGLISGNGPVETVVIDSGYGGIKLVSPPANYYWWITEADGDEYYFVGDTSTTQITESYLGKPLPSLWVIQPPNMIELRHAFGRIWGANGKNIYYSEALAFEWFKEKNRFAWPEEVIMIAPMTTGIFVGSLNNTWVLKGKNPNEMIRERVGDGVVPGSLVYGEVQQSGREVPTWRHKSILPLWMTEKGFVAGNEHFYLTNLTEERLFLRPGRKAAALHRIYKGEPQFIVSMPRAYDTELGDSDVNSAFKDGTLY